MATLCAFITRQEPDANSSIRNNIGTSRNRHIIIIIVYIIIYIVFHYVTFVFQKPPTCGKINGVSGSTCDDLVAPEIVLDFNKAVVRSTTKCVRNLGITVAYHCILN